MMISNNTSAENNAILTLILSHQKKSSKHYIDLAQSKQAKIHVLYLYIRHPSYEIYQMDGFATLFALYKLAFFEGIIKSG